MHVLQPDSLAEALAAKAEHPDAVPVAGGTDVMVEFNFDRRRPAAMLDLTRVPELAQCGRDNGTVRLGSGVTYTRLISELAAELPGLAIASRTVGSPQIRNRGTVGGNLGTASPAGDALPPLIANSARVEVASAARGPRFVDAADFIVRPKQSALEPDELIVAVHVPAARGPQQFAKIGSRNAMVIAVASFALVVDREARTVGTAIGSAGPTVNRAAEAEAFLGGALADADQWNRPSTLDRAVVTRFGELVAAAARPRDDLRGTAAYRRHALGVVARRALVWAWRDLERTD